MVIKQGTLVAAGHDIYTTQVGQVMGVGTIQKESIAGLSGHSIPPS